MECSPGGAQGGHIPLDKFLNGSITALDDYKATERIRQVVIKQET